MARRCNVLVERPAVAYCSGTGRSIAYQVVGDVGPPVVSLHEWFSNLDAGWDDPGYARQLRRFGASCRLILLDKSGCGLSDRVVPSGDHAFDVWSDEVVAVLNDLGIDRASLMVASWSGPFGIHLAERHQDRFERLVLWGTFAQMGSDDRDSTPGVPPRRLVERARDHLVAQWGTGVLVETMAIDPGKYGRERLALYERAAASRGDVGALADCLFYADSRQLLSRIDIKTLVVDVENPLIRTEHSEYMHSQLRDSTFVSYTRDWRWRDGEDDVGPDTFAVLEFLTGVSNEPDVAGRLMILVFVDIVGSTGIAARLGDREWVDTLHELFDEAERRAAHYRGRVAQDTGDGFVALLPTVPSALRFAADVAAVGERLGAPLRVGVHAGDCYVEDDELRGLTVHAAARVCDFAGRGDIVVTDPIVALAPTDAKFDPIGVHELRGVPGEFRLHRFVS